MARKNKVIKVEPGLKHVWIPIKGNNIRQLKIIQNKIELTTKQ